MLKPQSNFVACWIAMLALFSGAAVSQTPSVGATAATAATTTATPASPVTEPKPFSNFIPTLSRKPSSTPTATTSVTTSVTGSGSITATQKPANSGEIFRWLDSKGKVQYSADVPEDRRFTAKKIDTRGNVVASRGQPSVQGASVSPPQAQPLPMIATPAAAAASAASAPKQAVTSSEKCEAAWAAYRAAEQCFAQYRQSAAGGAGGRAGARISEEAQQKCPALVEPQPCR